VQTARRRAGGIIVTVRTPEITELSWGRLEVDGRTSFKDAKVYPGGAREWDWGETGTSHRPGIQPADVQELLEHGARTVILARGVWGRLAVQPDTLETLTRAGVDVHVLDTKEAVRLFNQLRTKESVGGLFHTTC
jgi:hypothetical protein